MAYMPIAVKKKVENSAQNAWWRIALRSVQPSSNEIRIGLFHDVRRAGREQPPRQQQQRQQEKQRDGAENLIAPRQPK